MAIGSDHARNSRSPARRPVVSEPRSLWLCLSAALLVLFYLYVWLRINPALVYHAYWLRMNIDVGVPVFFFSAPFLQGFLLYPGDAVECAAALLGQFYQLPWLGAAIITSVASALCAEAFVILRAFGVRAPRLLYLGPALVLLVLYSLYLDPLSTSMGLVLALLGVCLCVWLGRCAAPVRLLVFAFGSVALYCAVGGAYLICAGLCGAYELLVSRRYVSGFLCLACGALVPYFAGARLFSVSIEEAYTRVLPFRHCFGKSQLVLGVALYLFFPVAAVVMFALGRLARRGRAGRDDAEVARTARPPASAAEGSMRRALKPLALVGVVVAAVCLTLDGRMKALTAVDYYAARHMWPEVLKWAAKAPLADVQCVFVSFDVNRALYHIGALPDRMFSCPQSPVSLVLSSRRFPDLVLLKRRAWMKFSDLLTELGCVNEAEHVTCEAMAFFGDHPRMLERVALLRIAKGQARVGRVLLGLVRHDPVHGGRARELLRMMDEDPMLSEHPVVKHLRSLRLQEDVVGWQSAEQMLIRLLEQNKHNRMAFEYLMAYYMLVCRLADFAQNIGRLGDFDYQGIPRHYEEALLVHELVSGEPVDLAGRRISRESIRRFWEVRRILARNGGASAAALSQALDGYEDTYFHYYFVSLAVSGR